MNLEEVITLLKDGGRDPFLPRYLQLPLDVRAKNTRGKQKDYKAHARYIALAAGCENSNEVLLSRIGHGFEATLGSYLRDIAKGTAVVNNCQNTYRLVLECAVALGHVEPAPPVYNKPKRHSLTGNDANGVRQVLRPKLNTQREPYAAKKEELPVQLREDLESVRRFYTDRAVRGRGRKPLRKSTWDLNEERILRFYGALDRMGHPLKDAQLTDFVQLEFLEVFVDHFLIFHSATTVTLEDILRLAKKLATTYFKDKSAANDIEEMISQMTFVRVKDVDQKIHNVTADDLYHLADCVYEHAMAYKKAHFKQKPGKAIQHPKAMSAYHFGRALVIHLALATWLRKANLFGIEYDKHLYYRGETLWFRFSAAEMKSKSEHHGQVRDLWRGMAAMRRLHELLAEYLVLRPYLVERFLANHPGEEPPKELFLTKMGTPFAPNGAWYLFSSLSRQYLGSEKEIHPHNVRHIVPSWLLRKHGYPIFTHIKTLLGHRRSETTEAHYTRVQRIFSADLGQEVIDKQREQEEMAERLRRVEGMLEAGGVESGDLSELKALIAELKNRLAS